MDEHPSVSVFSPSKASSISSSGIFSMLKGFLLALIIKVKWSSYKYLSFFAVFIGMPICVLVAVFFFTVIITVPIALIFGWL